VDKTCLLASLIIKVLIESNFGPLKYEMWFFTIGPALGEIILIGQMNNLDVENGLDRVFKVIDHYGADRI
jgi:hypothetical protein